MEANRKQLIKCLVHMKSVKLMQRFKINRLMIIEAINIITQTEINWLGINNTKKMVFKLIEILIIH